MGVILSRPENKHQPRHHEPPVRGLDTHSQSVIQEGMSKDTEQYVQSYQSGRQSRKLETKRRTADHNIEEETQYEMCEAAMDEGNLFYSISMLPKIAELILLNTPSYI